MMHPYLFDNMSLLEAATELAIIVIMMIVIMSLGEYLKSSDK